MAQKRPNTKLNWFEIFRAGEHTDSNGKTAEFSQTDLQSVVSNFKKRSSPLVVGHPKTDDPAWGWAEELKIEGDTLYAKAEEVDADFAEAVEKARYPNRSVRLRKTDNGYELGHIGFLGGKPPAIDGMQWLFNEDEDGAAVVLEFAASDRIEQVALDGAQGLVRLVTNLKTFITDRFGAEEASKVFADWEAEHIQQQVTLAEHERHLESIANPQSEFAAPQQEETEVSDKKPTEKEQALQAQLDAANKQNAELQFNQRKSAAQTFIDNTLNGGKAPRITNTEGLAEFMAHLEQDAEQTFEFAAADGDKTSKPVDWFKGFLQALPEQKGLTKDFSKDDKDEPGDLTAEQLADKGRTISISAAMDHIKSEAS